MAKKNDNAWKSAQVEMKFRRGHGPWLQVVVNGKLFIMRRVKSHRETAKPEADPFSEEVVK